ncbi:MAG: mycothiol maleylpyruvate isomerase [Glaciihabitans sp.]|nr:mycothiol maleylpyruvate isomerase [Glaciihabitans sp.]
MEIMGQTEKLSVAANAVIHLVERIDDTQWGRPALGTWTVLDLVGHTSRALVTVREYLAAAPKPPAPANVPDAESYYRRVFSGYTDHAAVARRGVQAGEALGDDVAAALHTLLASALEALAGAPADATVTVGELTIPVEEYLRTRVFELVVHGYDIARATAQILEMPREVIADCAALAARVAALRGSGREVLFALTGRDTLPGGFSIF